jgi:enamine deaminase RidA (YjgF/YER057c/UK114 family)
MTTGHFTAHNPASIWQIPGSFRSIYSHAAEVARPDRLLFISGQFGVAPDGRIVEDFPGQCEQAMDNVEALLAAGGMTTANIAKLTYYTTDAADVAALVQIRHRRWTMDPAPAVTAIAVAALARPDYRIEIEAIAVAPADMVA